MAQIPLEDMPLRIGPRVYNILGGNLVIIPLAAFGALKAVWETILPPRAIST
jgi:hypothetical protein